MANPNPSPETRFKPGQSGNPSGRSSEELHAMNEAAKISANLRLKALSCLQEKLNSKEITADELIDPNVLRLFKDSEDRAHGTPKQTVAGDPEAPLEQHHVIELRGISPVDR